MKSLAIVAAISSFLCMSIGNSPTLLIADETAATDAQKLDFFERHIRPVLVEHCYECHSTDSKTVEGELLLDSRDATLAGGVTGKSVVPGDAKSSLLIKALRYEDLEMPPTQRLSDEVIKHFEQWIADGAVDPRVATAPVSVKSTKIDWTNPELRQHWSFQPVHPQSLPSVANVTWPQRRIDQFILNKMEIRGLTPSPAADQSTLIRRLSLDLTGLPAQYADVQRVLADQSPQAIANWVEQLVASPAFGESWARLWLDLARYGEDQAHIVGNDRSLCYPNAYKYRDWVVEAFNADLPYDEFVSKQIAADLTPAESPDLRPLGFLGLGPKYYNRGTPEVMAEEWEDRVDVVTRGVLGLTVACARCHDHKYDPIPTDDYYGLAGVFASTAMYNLPIKDEAEKKDNGEAKKPEDAIHVVRDSKSKTLNVAIRGDVKRKGDLAPRRFLRAIAPESEPWPVTESSGRSELAAALIDPANPLTARVFVNRVWGRMFGQFLVSTPSNFGRLGALPSHPELLDDLADRFMENGWSLKWLVREIALSATYQQSSISTTEQLEKDPDNILLSHMNRKRLPIEAWRDSILAAAGRLDRRVGGPSIDPQKPDETRRTLYSEVSRLEVNKMLSLFDFPDPNAHSERRVRTTTSLQKLFVLNSPFMVAQSTYFSQQLVEPVTSSDLKRRVETAIQRAFARSATEEELTEFTQFLESSAPGQLPGANEAWRLLAHVLLASNELAYVD